MRYDNRYKYTRKKTSGKRNYPFANQIHVGQFFGSSFKIIDKGAIRWFAAVGLSMDGILDLDSAIDIGGFTLYYTIGSAGTFELLIGPELNSYITYMFNPSLGLSLGGNFAYYFFNFEPMHTLSLLSGGFGIFVTFAPQGVKPRDRRLRHGDR